MSGNCYRAACGISSKGITGIRRSTPHGFRPWRARSKRFDVNDLAPEFRQGNMAP